MLGDSGVAVNPSDERYQALLEAGAQIHLPLMDRVIPLVADEYVDPSFGTGAVKVTPAHDPNDFDIGLRHDLEQINVFTDQAVVNELGGRFAGMTREEAREAVVAAFEELGLLDHVDDHDHAVGHCYRCDTTIEPWASEQWFVRMKELAAPAIEAVRSDEVRFNPRRWENVYFQWMENIRDWCISRQLWWGHRIPVFYCDSCGWQDASADDLEICPKCGKPLRQDEDVLDTWFSSQLWPFATQGWPSEPGWQEELDSYYPTQVLSTARDIIFLWVARMIISSMYFQDGKVPFTDVIIHPTILDKHGNIMSKSRGNGIDPMELVANYGADVMRFGLAGQVTGSQDIKFDEEKLSVYRNFATKILNAARFIQMKIEDYRPLPEEGKIQPVATTTADRWILSRLARLTDSLNDPAKAFEFGEQGRELYNFFWNEFCDWYIELSKGQLENADLRLSTQKNLIFVLDQALRLLHPVMPFITEHIWQQLPHGDDRPSLVIARWPESDALKNYTDDEAEHSIELLTAVVTAVRSTRARYQISPREPLRVAVRAPETQANASQSSTAAQLLDQQAAQIKLMAQLAELSIACDLEKPASSIACIGSGLEIFIVLEDLLDFQAELQRLQKLQSERNTELQKLKKKLGNEGFLAKAAADIIEKTKASADALATEIEQLDVQIADLQEA
jgi:valyl-tRNA synthetase